MYRAVLGLVFCLALSDAAITNCGTDDSVGNLVGASVVNCDHNSDVCILKRSKNTGIILQFEAAKDITKVNTIVTAAKGVMQFTYNDVESDGCKNSGLVCPLSNNGGTYTYETNLYVQPWYPEKTLIVKWELKDEDNKNIVCVKIPVKID